MRAGRLRDRATYVMNQEAEALRRREIIEHNKRVQREVWTAILALPVGLFVLYWLFVFVWSITPQAWW